MRVMTLYDLKAVNHKITTFRRSVNIEYKDRIFSIECKIFSNKIHTVFICNNCTVKAS